MIPKIQPTFDHHHIHLKTKEVKTLKENEYILLPHLTWNTFEFLEEDTSILVLGSEDFDEDEYIRDYDEFIQRVNDYEDR